MFVGACRDGLKGVDPGQVLAGIILLQVKGFSGHRYAVVVIEEVVSGKEVEYQGDEREANADLLRVTEEVSDLVWMFHDVFLSV